MSIIIDANTFSAVFKETDENHNKFRPVHDWIYTGEGKIVFGGKKYKAELQKLKKYLPYLKELNIKNKIVKINDDVVDENEKIIKKLCADKDFDDQHIVAIVISSNCGLICSKDERAYPYFKDSRFYNKNIKRPKLYTSERNKDLLCKENIRKLTNTI